MNGVQPAAHQNGVSANGEAADFAELIQLNNSGNPAQTQSALVGEPILAFEAGEPFLMKTGPMKPQHVAGTVKRCQIRPMRRQNLRLHAANTSSNKVQSTSAFSLK